MIEDVASGFNRKSIFLMILTIGLASWVTYVEGLRSERNKKERRWTQETLTVYLTRHVPIGSTPKVAVEFLHQETGRDPIATEELVTDNIEEYEEDIIFQRYVSERWLVEFQFIHGKMKSVKVLPYTHHGLESRKPTWSFEHSFG